VWLFPRGGDKGPFGCVGIGVVRDGRLVWVKPGDSSFSSGASVMWGGESGRTSHEPCLNESGLSQMARRLGY
jgi:hypothetical protein